MSFAYYFDIFLEAAFDLRMKDNPPDKKEFLYFNDIEVIDERY